MKHVLSTLGVVLLTGSLSGCLCAGDATIGGNTVHPRDSGAGGGAAGGGSGGGQSGSGGGGGTTSADAGSATEVCGNGFDDNNNGFVDEGCSCAKDATQPCWTGAANLRHVGACRDGTQTCTAGGELSDWSACANQQLPTAEIEGNCVDEDCDGKAPGCPVGCGGEFPELCDDGADNNCDGKVDCNDPTCLSNAKCTTCANSQPETDTLCNDGYDNDCNGKIDCAEASCAGNCTVCTQQSPSEYNCTDRLDDDCDGKVDCADPDCRYPGVCGCALHETACHNEQDDDCDGTKDCADGDCEICTPGTNRYCDEPTFCHFGQQTCQSDGTWGSCHEVTPPSQCKQGGIFGAFGTDYDQECCVAAGLCCQNYHSGGGSIGSCGNSISCKP